MMTAKKAILFWMLLVCGLGFAQQDAVVNIREVTVSDILLQRYSKTQTVSVLNDSVIARNAVSLTSLLNYNSNIYFKENGFGMVSSPSFRGTTAQQTAVIWNGININSQLNGQVDFNTIPTGSFDSVSIRAGGGSSIYGTGAVGGSVHLSNDLRFRNEFSNAFQLRYGSFETFGADYKIQASTEKLSAQVALSRNSSQNDYKYPGTKDKRNENGQYYNTSANAAFGYKISKIHFLKLYSQVFEGERHFSGTIASKSKSKYQNVDSRNLLEWDALLGKWTSTLRLAFLSEQYKYFEDAKDSIFEGSKAETVIAKYDLAYKPNRNISTDVVVDYTQTKGIGKNIGDNSRSIASAAFLLRHQLFRTFGYEFSLKKEMTSNYNSKLLLALGTRLEIVKNYSVLVNASRNFRIPTFNDLYWQGLGNRELNPEKSNQLEIGQQLHLSDFYASATAFYIDITDMIQWSPGEDGIWKPSNVAHVKSRGVEVALDWNQKIGQHRFDFHTNYAFTISKDAAGEEQLMYVPVNKWNGNAAYSYRKFSLTYQYLFNGQVYTPSQKFHTVKSYQVSNAEIDYNFGKKNVYKIGFEAGNLFGENYQSVLQRPMPGRNYSILLTLKF